MAKTKAILYCRVSSKEQEESGYSLDSQEKLLKNYAIDRELQIKKNFKISESASGKQIRKVFDEMLGYATKNKIPIVICEKTDRLTRNMKDAVSVSDWLAEDEKREVHFVKESFIVNKHTRAHDNLVWDMKVAIARFYINNLSEEVKKGQKEKIAQGWLPTKPLLGYKTIGEKGKKIHIQDENTAPLIRKMFEFYSTGEYSLKRLVEKMSKEGLRSQTGKKIGKSVIHRFLSNPFYMGKLPWKGEVTKGNHDPIVSKELFNLVQEKLFRKIKNPYYRKHLSLFGGKIKCEKCGGAVTWEIQKGHWYGHCNYQYKNCNQKKFVRQKEIEKQIIPYFDKIAPKNKRIVEWLEKALKESHKDEIGYNTNKREKLVKIIKSADKRIEGAYRDKLDGRMPAGLCSKMIQEATEEKESTSQSLENMGESRQKYYEAGIAIHELATNAKEIYQSEKATIEDKRMLLGYLFSNITMKDGIIKPEYTFAFEFLAEWMPKLNKNFEPAKNSLTKTKKRPLASSCPVLLPLADMFRTFSLKDSEELAILKHFIANTNS